MRPFISSLRRSEEAPHRVVHGSSRFSPGHPSAIDVRRRIIRWRALVAALVVALVSLCVHGRAYAASPAPRGDEFERHRVELLKWVPREEFSDASALVKGCWGYVSPSGREYGIACHTPGTTFFDVTDPANPVDVGFIDAPDSDWREVKIYQDNAYIVGESGPGIQVVDLSQIDEGVVTLIKEVTTGGNPPTHTVEINEDSGYLYRCAGGSGFPTYGLRIYDLVDPDDPLFVAEWNNRYVHDAQIVTFHEGPYAGREIAFCAAEDNVGGGNPALDIVDVTDKSNIFLVSTTPYPKGVYAHQGWLTDDRKYFYLNDELDEQDQVIPCTSRVFDVSVLETPSVVNAFFSGTPSTDHNLYLLGRLMFQSNYSCGLRIFDITDPERPVQIAYFDTRPEDNNAGLIASYSNYPYLPSGTIIGTDRERGFFVWDVSTVWDCDGDGMDDGRQIAADPLLDSDRNRVLDTCQNILHVPGDYPNIQAAVDAAAMSDMIVVADGVYSGAGNYAIEFNGKVVTLMSENGADHTTIDAAGMGRVMDLSLGESFGTIIDGFTITGGSATLGGGIYCVNSGPIVRNCIITGNAATSSGGGVYCDFGNPQLINCLFTNNTSNGSAGAVYARNDSNLLIQNCTFTGNTAVGSGGAISLLRAHPTVVDSILWGDSAANGDEVAVILGSIKTDYSIIQGGTAGFYLVSGTIDSSNAVLDQDPLFIEGPRGGYYISQVAAGQATNSPGLDAGSTDAAALSLWPLTTRTDQVADAGVVDLGYHYPAGTVSPSCDGDANGDNVVDPLDSGFVLSRFGCAVSSGDSACDAADVNADGLVDPLDAGYVLSRLGGCP